MVQGGGDAWDSSSLPNDRHDDDELADALAEQVASITSAIPIVSSEQLSDLPPPFAALRQEQPNGFPPPMPPPAGGPVVPPGYWPVSQPDGFPPASKVWRLGDDQDDGPTGAPPFEAPVYETPVSEATQTPPAEPGPPSAPTPPEAPAPPAAPFDPSAFRGAPPPAPHTAVIPPPGSELPEQPPRRSLDDGELASLLGEVAPDGEGTGAFMDRLEEQLRLREQDEREFNTWERSMAAIGTPEAREAVERARSTIASPSTPAGPPAPNFDSVSTPTSVPTPTAETEEVPWPVSADEPEPLDEPAASETGASPYIPDLSYIPNLEYDPGMPLDDAIDDDDAVDAEDRMPQADAFDEFFPVPVAVPVGVPTAATIAAPASVGEYSLEEPLTAFDEPAPHPKPVLAPAFRPEEAGPEPTALERRAARATSLFWTWFAVNSSVIGIGLGAVLLTLGMSLRQSVIAALAGVALSFLPLGLTSLAGKWSGQPTMIASRAVFGVHGNVVPAIIAVVSRIAWGGTLLWVLAAGTAHVLVAAGADGGLGEFRVGVIALGGAFVITLLIAFFGYTLIARISLVFSILSAILIGGVIALTWDQIDLTTALTVDDGPWILVVTGAVLVFSAVGLAWANSGADVARYQRPGGSGAASMLWSTIGMGLPSFVLIGYGALLAASKPELGMQLATDPLGAVASLLPAWYPLPLVAALALGLISAVVMALYSGSFALQATGLPIRRSFGVLIAGILVAVAAAAILLTFDGFTELARDAATTLAVPVAAWVGLFCADIMIRNHPYHAPSLLRAGGIYPSINWVNLVMLVVASVLGFGLITGAAAGFDWQGYLLPLLSIDTAGALGESDFGVLVALGLGILTPIVAGIPAIRRQERATTVAGG